METSNFSDNDYLKSDSLVIRDGEAGDDRDEEEEMEEQFSDQPRDNKKEI